MRDDRFPPLFSTVARQGPGFFFGGGCGGEVNRCGLLSVTFTQYFVPRRSTCIVKGNAGGGGGSGDAVVINNPSSRKKDKKSLEKP